MLHVPRLARLHERWVMLAVTGLTVLMAAGVTAVPAVLIHPLEVAFGWDRPRSRWRCLATCCCTAWRDRLPEA